MPPSFHDGEFSRTSIYKLLGNLLSTHITSLDSSSEDNCHFYSVEPESNPTSPTSLDFHVAADASSDISLKLTDPVKAAAAAAGLLPDLETHQRKREHDDGSISSPNKRPKVSHDLTPNSQATKTVAKGLTLSHVRPSELVRPKSQYEGWKHRLPVSREGYAIEELKVRVSSSSSSSSLCTKIASFNR